MDAYAKAVLFALAELSGGAQTVVVHWSELAEIAGMSRGALYDRMGELEERGLVNKDGKVKTLVAETEDDSFHSTESDSTARNEIPQHGKKFHDTESDSTARNDGGGPSSPSPRGQTKVSTPSKESPNPSSSSPQEDKTTAATKARDDEYREILEIDDGQSFLIQLAHYHGFELSPSQSASVWVDVCDAIPDGEARRRYVRRKLSSLESGEYGRRAVHDALCDDAEEWWLEQQRERDGPQGGDVDTGWAKRNLDPDRFETPEDMVDDEDDSEQTSLM